jgi:hypothetical protein
MKTFFLPVILLASVMLLFTQCKKDNSSNTSASFTPLTTGTNWTYSYQEGTAPAQTFKLTVTNKDTIANGKTYKVITSSDGGPNNYMAKVGSDYYRYASIAQVGLNNFEELYLKDNANVNDNWTGTASINVSGTQINGTMLYTIKGKGQSRTVNQTAFNKVTHVRLDLSVQIFGNVGGGDFYYQEGVGMIENNIAITNPLGGAAYASTQKITAYEIK